MADFTFLKNKTTGKYVILAPRRSKRTNVGGKATDVCPFCIGQEAQEEELYRVSKNNVILVSDEGAHPGSETKDSGQARMTNNKDSDWAVRVIPNKFPFTPHHEIIIHSPDHHKNIDELALPQVELIFETYRQRFNENKQYGEVYI